jgi:murein DD-endopeptidase MepM/ murein hydrolase activator NlpD
MSYMRIKGANQDLTFIYLPDAGSPIRTARFSRRAFYLILIFTTVVIAALLWWQFSTFIQLNLKITGLQQQLDSKHNQYKLSLENKNDTIEHLHKDIYQLSQQAEQLEHQVKRLQTLEQEIYQLSDEIPGLPPTTQTDGAEKYNEITPSAFGGANIPISDQQLQTLITSTDQWLSSLKHDLDELSMKLEDDKINLTTIRETLRRTPDIWPTSSTNISSGFGLRTDPFTRNLRFHSGLDITGSADDPVFAAADGTVEFSGSGDEQGNYITINHGGGLHTVYMHLSKSLVKEGSPVVKGEHIGLMGSTGRSTGTHLHYEIHLHGVPTNPLQYIP